MKTRLIATCALLLAIGTPASAHRMDEYLQATTISVEQDRVQAEMRLTPGVAVVSKVLAAIDANGDGVISKAEQRVYAERVLRDLSLTIDGSRLPLRLGFSKFAKIEEMREGCGEIQLDFSADAPHAIGNRTLVFENHHQSRIAAYLVNCLVLSDPHIQIIGQKRNYQQSRYQLDYMQVDVPQVSQSSAGRPGVRKWLGAAALLLIALLAWHWRRAGAAVPRENPNEMT